MANVNAPFGLRPVRYLGGAPYDGASNAYYVSSTYASAIGVGSAVVVDGTADSVTGRPRVILATAGTSNFVTGAVIAVKPVTGDSPLHLAASTGGVVYVADNPSIVFEVQCSSSLASGDISANANFSTNTVNTTTGFSNLVLDDTSVGTEATKQARLLGLSQAVNSELGLYAKAEIVLNTSSIRRTTGV